MKSFAFAAALIAAVQAVDLEWGYAAPVYSAPSTSTSAYGAQAAKVDGGALSAASKSYGSGHWGKTASDWDAWGRDQDLSIDESYDRTKAKSYEAASYDEWDNQDDDKWGQQAWGKDRDVYGASSYGKAASEKDVDNYGASSDYDKASYGAQAAQGLGASSLHGASATGKGYGGYGWGGYGGYGKGSNSAALSKAALAKQAAGSSYAAKSSADAAKTGSSLDKSASASYGAAKSAYDNDMWAKQASGSDFDSRWGKSYDSVSAKSYDNEQYRRKVDIDDDQYAEDYDRISTVDDD